MELPKEIYYKHSHRHGGHLQDIPLPHVRFFPNSYFKRKVFVTITRYYGIGIHYYVSIREEDNPIWNSTDEIWQSSWDDKEGNGSTDLDLLFKYHDKSARIRTEYYENAVSKAKSIIKKYFKDYEVVWDGLEEKIEIEDI